MIENLIQGTDSNKIDGKTEIYDKFGSLLLYFLAIIAPLAIYTGAADQTLALKYLLLKISALLLVGTFISKIIIRGTKLKLSGIEWPLLVLIILLALSTALSIHPRTSLWGTYERYDGMLSYTIYAILFFSAIQYLSSKSRFTAFVKISVITAGIVSIYGIAQHFGFDPVPWGFISFDLTRSFSTIGNPVWLGAYLGLMLPQSLGLMLSSKSIGQRTLYASSAVVIGICLIMTMSRGAWLGVLLGLAVMAIISIKKGRITLQTAFMPAVVLAIVTALSLFSIGLPVINSRAGSIFNLSGSAGTRLSIWKSALAMISDRPLFGFGPDTIGLVIPRYELLERVQGAPLETFDNVHNAFLQLAATSGIPALLAFITIIVMLLAMATRHIKLEDDSFPIKVGVMGGIIAYIAQSLTGITCVGTSTFLWLSMGSLAASWARDDVEIQPIANKGKYIIIAVITIAMIFGIVASTKPFLSNIALAKARIAEWDRDTETAEKFYKEAIAYDENDEKAYGNLGLLLVDKGSSLKDKNVWLKGMYFLNKATRLSPDSQMDALSAGQGYIYGARAFDKKYYEDAEQILQKAVAIGPNSALARFMLGVVYLDTGCLEKAKDSLLMALTIDPNNAQAHYHMGRYYEMSKQKSDALREYGIALEKDAKHDRAKAAYERLKNERK